MGNWSFILTDLNFAPVGEVLNATERKVTLGLNKLSTAGFKVRLDNPLASYLSGGMGYLKAYRDDALRFFGPVVSIEESGERENATIAVNAAGSEWIFAHRLAGKNATGIAITAPNDRALIVRDLIATAQVDGETHIDYTTGPISAASATTYSASPYKPISEVITDLSATFDGFDWRVIPVDNWNPATGTTTSQKIGRFTAAPLIGTNAYDGIFEYGTGRNNVVSYKRTLARDTQANVVYHNVQAGPDVPNASTVVAQDLTTMALWGRLEALAQADILDTNMRQSLVNEHVNVRKNPRQVVEFQPHIDDGTGRVPNLGTDYDIGDTVTARIVYNGSMRLNAAVRLWGIDCTVDEQGVETINLTLADSTS